MLVLSRKKGDSIIINENIEITVVDISGDQIKLGISAPKDVSIYRKEIFVQIQEENKQSILNTDIKSLSNLFKKK